FAYDAFDRQRSHTEPTGTTSIHYDGLGQNIAIETAPTTGIDTAYELSPSGLPKADKVNTAIAPTIEYLTSDGFGDISTVSTTSASIKCTARFDPFGGPLSLQATDNPCSSGTKPASDIFFRGGRRDATTGQYQLGSRTYDPSKGSFLQSDSYRQGSSAQNLSIGVDPLTRNTYTYVNGDPINLSDP